MFLQKARLWLYGSRIFIGEHCGFQLLCLGSSHVHHGHIELFGFGVLAYEHDGRYTFRNQGF
jgi:hypothetical protein